MNRLFVGRNHRYPYFDGRALISLWALWFGFGLVALAQSTATDVNADKPFSIQATHVLGFEKTKNNCNGTLFIQDDMLQFQQGGEASTQIKIASVRGVFLSEEDQQVGGVPMTLGKAAAPYGGGRVVSLFAHKNYDILTLEYIGVDGGVHGVIFQLSKGQGDLVRNELVARGVPSSSGEKQSTKQSTAGVTNENK